MFKLIAFLSTKFPATWSTACYYNDGGSADRNCYQGNCQLPYGCCVLKCCLHGNVEVGWRKHHLGTHREHNIGCPCFSTSPQQCSPSPPLPPPPPPSSLPTYLPTYLETYLPTYPATYIHYRHYLQAIHCSYTRLGTM